MLSMAPEIPRCSILFTAPLLSKSVEERRSILSVFEGSDARPDESVRDLRLLIFMAMPTWCTVWRGCD